MTVEHRVTALIADDEPLARAGMRAMLAPIEWITCVGEAANGPAALDAIDTLRPELVFLDIQMPGMLGTEVARRATHDPYVIFTTAWAQHAAEAFELGALDYLLKPFGADRLALTLERVRASMSEPVVAPALDRYRETSRGGPISRVFVRSGRAIIPVAVDSVSWFEADGDYVAVHVGRARHLVHVALSRLETRLDPARFARIHRTSIVNLDHVKAFKRLGKGRLVAELTDGTLLDVSRSKARELRALGE
ncbi:MAG: response regulator transcription factor [Gemmatimonadaceae bacterium]|nr:response regulator transcription factor [Gemmatimonadaceae bacterium]